MNPLPATSVPFRPLEPERVDTLNRLWEVRSQLAQEDREQLRYGAAAKAPEACLCTPVDYEASLDHIPERILAVDFGCGDPTRYAREGETVIDLGSGSGKHVFMMARKVGPKGHVIGIDKTPNMLTLARGAITEVAQKLGSAAPRMEFRRGLIENLRWDLDRLESLTATQPLDGYEALDRVALELDRHPLVASDSVDLVVSNCVLNLVADHRKKGLFHEIYRVLRQGGRAVISDIVAEVDVPQTMKEDDHLWTGCVSGALRRDRFLDAFIDAGFYGVRELSSFFWLEEGGIRFHSVTVEAFKGKEGACWETYRQAYYPGPFAAVHDDDGHVYPRGVAIPVCEKTARILGREPYAGQFLISDALIDESEQIPFDCNSDGRAEIPAGRQHAPAPSRGLASGSRECAPGGGCC
ncbi:MAG: methyltransferase domain-containing protein [Planctomycetota bacterium]